MAQPADRGGHIWAKDRETCSADGTAIRYTVRGDGDGPWVVLCPGFVCGDNFWTYLVPELESSHRVAIPNYRALGASGLPRDPGPFGLGLRSSDYSIERHAEDVVAVLETEGIASCVLVGHSMGTQVALEVYRALGSERVAGIGLVTGPYASPLKTFYGTGLGARIFPLAYFAARVAPEPLVRLTTRIAHLPGILDLAQVGGAIGPRTPRDPMHLWLEHVAELDAGAMVRVAKGMHHHDASDLLDDIEVPALVVSGTKDTFTPPHVGAEMAERIPDCEILVVDGATHCALIEEPRAVNDAILSLLDRAFTRT
jgi:pimeloyl-ACP methyl ester carboxylesterase